MTRLGGGGPKEGHSSLTQYGGSWGTRPSTPVGEDLEGSRGAVPRPGIQKASNCHPRLVGVVWSQNSGVVWA